MTWKTLALLLMLGIAACSGNSCQKGSSPDYGVMKWGDDHVITVHGFVDDFGSCQEIVTAMNFNACKELDGTDCLDPYSCALLN
ncbi:MAG: hypothetical protein MN733_21505 [Nitrososphaera sp.]|nr:hypothetical protein [Nitrososphaera sp.]